MLPIISHTALIPSLYDIYSLSFEFTRERLLNELRETEEASRRQAEVLVKVSFGESILGFKFMQNA